MLQTSRTNLQVHNVKNIPLVVPHDKYSYCGRKGRVTNDTIIFTHIKLTMIHLVREGPYSISLEPMIYRSQASEIGKSCIRECYEW